VASIFASASASAFRASPRVLSRRDRGPATLPERRFLVVSSASGGSSPAAYTSGAPSAMAAFRPVTYGRSSYFTSTSRAASSATSGDTAATAATSWPAKRIFRDSVAHTAFTPGSACAFDVSMDTISAAGTRARTIFPHNIPGTLTSKVYFARPVTLSGASRRG
jgi:hypothetical protein